MSRYNTILTAAKPEAVTLYNDKNRTSGDEIDLTFIRHADPARMVTISRSAGYDQVNETTIEAARDMYRARLGQGYRKLGEPRYAFVGIDYCGRYTVRATAPAEWPEPRR